MEHITHDFSNYSFYFIFFSQKLGKKKEKSVLYICSTLTVNRHFPSWFARWKNPGSFDRYVYLFIYLLYLNKKVNIYFSSLDVRLEKIRWLVKLRRHFFHFFILSFFRYDFSVLQVILLLLLLYQRSFSSTFLHFFFCFFLPVLLY